MTTAIDRAGGQASIEVEAARPSVPRSPEREADGSRSSLKAPVETPPGEHVEPGSGVAELKNSVRLPDVQLRELSIRVSPETNRVVIEVIDSETKTVVRQIPPEDALDLLRHLPKHRAVFVDREG